MTQHTVKAFDRDADSSLDCVIAGNESDAAAISHLFRIAPRNDIRWYLNGVFIDGNRASATNGHMLGTCVLQDRQRPTRLLLRLSKPGRKWLRDHAHKVTEVRLMGGHLVFHSDGVLKWIDSETATAETKNYPDIADLVSKLVSAIQADPDQKARLGHGSVFVQPKYLDLAVQHAPCVWTGQVFNIPADSTNSTHTGTVLFVDNTFVHVIKALRTVHNVAPAEVLAAVERSFARGTEPVEVAA